MFKLLDKIAPVAVQDLREVVSDRRLVKYLWVEILVNPDAAAECRKFVEDRTVREAIVKAVSWYRAYRSLFAAANIELESLARDCGIAPVRIGWREYRENIRAFLKGLQCLELL